MSWVRRFANVFRQGRLDAEIEEELSAHIEDAMERGRSAEEAHQALGSVLRYRERTRDVKLLPWLDALGSDAVFGWRQLRKHRAVSLAAILSLALAMGATTTAFRIADALLFRTLPVAEPERLLVAATSYVDRNGRTDLLESFSYNTFRRYRAALADRADVMSVGISSRPQPAAIGSSPEGEQVWRQYLSGNVFGIFALRPALGRLLMPDDDLARGGDLAAVLSYDFWVRRFARDPSVIGQRIRVRNEPFVVVGVAPQGFTGTEPGRPTDVFLASGDGRETDQPGWLSVQIWIRPKAGFLAEQVRQPLQALFLAEQQARVQNLDSDTPKTAVDAYLSQRVLLLPAASGASDVQREYRDPSPIVALLVFLVLLIACANVGNLLTAQATSRAREMALRVSIGAGRWRLMQLALVESALLAAIACALGTLFAWWAAPFAVARLHVAADPVRLALQGGWRGLAFSAALMVLVTLLFGMAPALQASKVKPMNTLRGGEQPQSRTRLMRSLLALQMAFCVLVLFVAGLFVSTFQRLAHRPLGFSPDRILILDTSASGEQPVRVWMQVADQLRRTPGVQSVAVSELPLVSSQRLTAEVRLPGNALEERPASLLTVSPGFFETMRISLIAGRDLRLDDLPPRLNRSQRPLHGVGIVNEAFARDYFHGENPVGRSIEVRQSKDLSATMEIVGYVRDAVYRDLREPLRPTLYLPMIAMESNTILARTAGNPLATAPMLRREVSRARPDFRVRTVETQDEFLEWQMVRERLLATLSWFFAMVALALAAIGLYGVLNYSVTQQRREVGIRMALGAGPSQVVRRIVTGAFGVVCLGLSVGLAGGIACGRLTESLLFDIKATSPEAVAVPVLTLVGVALLAALFPAIRAVRIDPAETLRCE